VENFRRRKLFFDTGKIDCSWMSAWSRRYTEYFEIYKLLGSANFHETCRLISDQWRSFVGFAERLLRKGGWSLGRKCDHRATGR
jgi:hypothetical protein